MAQTTQQIIDFINSTSQPNSITGKILAEALNGLIAKSSYAGVAKLSTDPGTPEGSVFYIATEAGTFTHFNNSVVKAGEFAVFVYKNGSWLKESVNVASNLGSPDDDADAAGSAFARINKVVDDIRKINETLEAISLSASHVYHLELINALTTESDADTVKSAFTPLGAEEPVAPEIGDIISGKFNKVEREMRNVIVEYTANNTVGSPVATFKYTIDGVTTEFVFNSQTWSISDKRSYMPKLVFRWSSERSYYIANLSGSETEELQRLLIRTNIMIPEGYILYRMWKSKNNSKHRGSRGDTNKKNKKELRWTRPDAFCKFEPADGMNGNLPITLTFAYFDVNTNEYVYTTELTAVDFASAFITISPSAGILYGIRYKGNGYTFEMPPAPEDPHNATVVKFTFGLCFFRRKSKYNCLEKMTDVVPIGVRFSNVCYSPDGAVFIRAADYLEDLLHSITFCAKK